MEKLNALIREVVALEPDAPAIEFKNRWWTWGQLQGVGASLGESLRADGCTGGTRVACVMRNRPEVAAAILEILTSGHCLVTLNPLFPDGRLAMDVTDLRPAVVVATQEDWQRDAFAQSVRNSGATALVLPCEPESGVRVLHAGRSKGGLVNSGVSIEMLTSGTTGVPKRIPLKSLTLERAVLGAAVYDNRDTSQPQLRSGVQILNAPFAHISGVFALLNATAAGRKICLLDHFTVADWAEAVVRHRPAVCSAPPTALRMILDAGVPKEALSSLKAFRVGTAPLDPALGDAFYEKYGIPVLQNYGATEFAGGVAGWTLQDYKAFRQSKRGSVGRLNPGIEARVVDPDSGAERPPNEQGLLELRAAHLGDGSRWVRTTDLAVIDPDGFLFIRGRADNVIIRGGFKVFPEDLIRAIESHPCVKEAAIASVEDARLGHVPMAAYVPKQGAHPVGEEEMRSFLQSRLLKYQMPRQIVAVDHLPRTASMKVSQVELRKLFA